MYIKHKLALGFGIMVGLILLFATLEWQNLQTLTRHEIRTHRLLQMQQALLEARRHEKNYILRQDTNWTDQNRYWTGELIRLTQEVRAMGPFHLDGIWQQVIDLTLRYQQIIANVVEGPKGSPELIMARVESELVPVARQLQSMLKNQMASISLDRDKHFSYTENMHLFFIIFSMVVSVLLIVVILRPLNRSLAAGIDFAESISTGELSARMPDVPQDEIGNLLLAMQKMGQDLQMLENHNLRAQSARLALSALLESSLEPLTLQRQLEVALQIILTVPYLRLEQRGAIFLVDERRGTLHMAVSLGLDDTVAHNCQTVPIGKCLCGRAVAEGKLIYCHSSDARHEIRHEGMRPHGHYCIPILSRGKVLGLISLYLGDNHPQILEEETLLTSMACTLAGILERKRMEERLQHLAHHDLLTALPNRVLFAEHLAQALTIAIRGKDLLAVMLVDLDRFKHVNDTLGHAAGDRVLVTATQRIRDCLRASDLVARMGGDEFAIILSDLPQPEVAGPVADKIVQAVSHPIDLGGGVTAEIGASIGIAIFPKHGQDADSLLASADQAMYRVKERGRNGYCFCPDS
ncbi:MAG: GGDEF domain-containing protein [Magnetococcales bacterium]|nr:GGDEF domain-containing protein [Magnetococcales bacterium]